MIFINVTKTGGISLIIWQVFFSQIQKTKVAAINTTEF
jgi:hypothetical protein